MQNWTNEAGWDRGLRLAGGALLVVLAFTMVAGTLRIVFLAFGALLLVTGAVGHCPAYRVFGLNTCTLRKPGH